MQNRRNILLSWSSGKDSAWSLHVLRQKPEFEVVGLLTTVNDAYRRVAMHGVRVELLEAQAAALELPLWKVPIPSPCSNQQYELALKSAVHRAAKQNITAIAFGDLFLDDIRRYREDFFRQTELSPLFPIWGTPTPELARDMIDAGLCARLTCVDPKQLPGSFAGRNFDRQLLSDLPKGVDPCGERGEFHTFAYGGPMFRRPLRIRSGELVERDGFVFADIVGDEIQATDAKLHRRE